MNRRLVHGRTFYPRTLVRVDTPLSTATPARRFLTMTLIKHTNDVIAREVEVTHRLRRGLVVTGDDCVR